MEVNNDDILRFWQWFVKSEDSIKYCIENATNQEVIVEQMNEHILNWGVLTWDIGLNDDGNWFLSLSPNGNKEMLEVSQKIMDEAPEHMGWLFFASKPALTWNRQFTAYDSYMDEQFVDASEWHYVIFEEEDGTFELIIEAKNCSQWDTEFAETAAEQFVIQEVGELLRIQAISSIVLTHALDDDYQSAKAPITELKEHLDEVS